MTRSRAWGWTAFALSLVWCVLGLHPWKVFAQASAGYIKVTSTSALTYTDGPVTDGNVYQYQVTAFNAAGESAPATSGPAIIPATGTHTVTIAWVASSTAGVTYNVYRIQVVIPNPPGVASVTVN